MVILCKWVLLVVDYWVAPNQLLIFFYYLHKTQKNHKLMDLLDILKVCVWILTNSNNRLCVMFSINTSCWRWKRIYYDQIVTYLELQDIPTSVFHPDAFVNFFATTKQQRNVRTITKEERFKNTNNSFQLYINIMYAMLLRITTMTHLKIY